VRYITSRVVSQQTTVSNGGNSKAARVPMTVIVEFGMRQTSMISKTALEGGVRANAIL
jgi:hypothetical protein